MDTAQNLLFGVLAWRTGLVDADQFTAGCRRWAGDKDRPLADVFLERGWLSAAERAPLDQLLECDLRRHGGDALEALKAVGDAGTWRAVAATQDAGLRQWLGGVLPGAAWLEEDADKPRRGLLGGAVALAVVLALVGVVVLGGLGVTTALLMKQRQHMAIAEMEAMRAMQAEAAARERAEANHQLARQAVDRMFTDVAEKAVAMPGSEAERRRLLEAAAAYYETFLKEKEADPARRPELATAYRRLGDVQQQLGQKDKAQQAYREARDLLQKLAKESPTTEAYRKELAVIEEKLKTPAPPEKGKP
jgi:tetratricopeptide (TPR) repeat protein